MGVGVNCACEVGIEDYKQKEKRANRRKKGREKREEGEATCTFTQCIHGHVLSGQSSPPPPNMCGDKQALMLTRLEMGSFMAREHIFRNFFWPLLSPASFFSNKL